MKPITALMILAAQVLALAPLQAQVPAASPGAITAPIGRAVPTRPPIVIDGVAQAAADLCDEKCLLRAVVDQLKKLNEKVAAQQAAADALAAQITTMRLTLGQAAGALAGMSDRLDTSYDILKTIAWNGTWVCTRALSEDAGDITGKIDEFGTSGPDAAQAGKIVQNVFHRKCDYKLLKGRSSDEPDPPFAYSVNAVH